MNELDVVLRGHETRMRQWGINQHMLLGPTARIGVCVICFDPSIEQSSLL